MLREHPELAPMPSDLNDRAAYHPSELIVPASALDRTISLPLVATASPLRSFGVGIVF